MVYLLAYAIYLINVSQPQSQVSEEPRTPLIEAVSFVLTGSDASKVNILNGDQCIFQIGTEGSSETFFLNNIQRDRIIVHGHSEPSLLNSSGFTIVELHGPSMIEEKHESGMIYDGSELHKILQSQRPDFFQPKTFKLYDVKLNLGNADYQRVIRAIQYIYSHGCSGTKSRF